MRDVVEERVIDPGNRAGRGRRPGRRQRRRNRSGVVDVEPTSDARNEHDHVVSRTNQAIRAIANAHANLRKAVCSRNELAKSVRLQQRNIVHVMVAELDAQHRDGLILHVSPGRNTLLSGAIQQLAGRHSLAIGIQHILAQEHLMRGVRRVGLVLVDERRGLVVVLADVIGSTKDPVRPRLVRGPREHHEVRAVVGRAANTVQAQPVICADSDVTICIHYGCTINNAIGTEVVKRVIRLKGHDHCARSALVHEVKAVIEELTEQREPAVERRRQAFVGRNVGDREDERVVTGGTEHAVPARALDKLGGNTTSSLEGCEIVRRLVSNQVRNHARGGIEHIARRLQIARRRSNGLTRERTTRHRIRRPPDWIEQPDEGLVRRTPVLATGNDGVVAAIDGAKAPRMEGRRDNRVDISP